MKTIKLTIYMLFVSILFSQTVKAQVSFTADVTEGCAPLTINFTNTSTVGDHYYWYFNDGDPAYTVDATHTFNNPGGYGVYLEAYDESDNYLGIYWIDIWVYGSESDFYMSNDMVCPGDVIYFSAYSENYNVSWNFGDGSTDNSEYTSHSYNTPGTYEVTLITENVCGIDTVIKTIEVVDDLPITDDFYINISSYFTCPGDDVYFYSDYGYSSYLWDFGDGSTSSARKPSHTYIQAGNYAVSLTIANGCGNDTTLYDTVYIENDLPVSDIDMYINPNPICPGDIVTFEAWGQSATSYLWDFGNGVTSTEEYFQLSYDTPGEYQVTLTVTNGCGNDSTVYETLYVNDGLYPDASDYEYGTPEENACPGDDLIFYVYPTGTSYLWDFGDGTSTTQTEEFNVFVETFDIARHTYSAVGDYSVTLTLTNGCGNSFTNDFMVSIGNDIPVDGALMYNEEEEYYPGNLIPFYAYGGTTYQWNWGDNSGIQTTFGSLEAVTHMYTAPGDYTVSLTITNGCGNSDTYESEIVIIDPSNVIETNIDNFNTTIFPNPNKGEFNIEMDIEEMQNINISVYTLQGAIVSTENVDNAIGTINKQINLSNYSKGLYHIQITTGNGTINRKVIVY